MMDKVLRRGRKLGRAFPPPHVAAVIAPVALQAKLGTDCELFAAAEHPRVDIRASGRPFMTPRGASAGPITKWMAGNV